MEIKSTNNSNPKISFKARNFATIRTTIKNCKNNFDVYRLEYDDRTFLDTMSIDLKLKKLTNAQYPDKVLRSWKNIICNAILMSGFEEPQKSFLLVNNKRPCAIMTYKDLPDCYLDNIASWPVSKNNYIKYAGLSLIRLLFYNCKRNDTKKIELDMLKNSKINLKNFYERLGFVENPNTSDFDADLFINRNKMLATEEELDKFIKVDMFEENQEKINLSKVLDIKF